MSIAGKLRGYLFEKSTLQIKKRKPIDSSMENALVSMGIKLSGANRIGSSLFIDPLNNTPMPNDHIFDQLGLKPEEVLVRKFEGGIGHARSKEEAIHYLDTRQPNAISIGEEYLTRENITLIMVEGFQRSDIPDVLRFIQTCTGNTGDQMKQIPSGAALEWRFVSPKGTSPRNVELTYNNQVIYKTKKF